MTLNGDLDLESSKFYFLGFLESEIVGKVIKFIGLSFFLIQNGRRGGHFGFSPKKKIPQGFLGGQIFFQAQAVMF